uniref:Rho-type GTPase-activating protein 26 n=1 Tax=Caenorhabditis japonica TaxID=281687 RepID=A0A8R1DVH9_CAEJA
MVLRALEFSDSISDSPWFRQNLHDHEVALDDAFKNIKLIENQCKELIACTKKLSTAQRAFAKTLGEFKIETVGTNQTDDERFIATCLKEFASLINQVEDERMKLVNQAEDSYLEPIKRFRTEAIGRTLKEEKNKYDKESSKFYSTLEKHLHLSTVRKNDFREADAQLETQQKSFFQASLQYVAEVQSVQERMRFEFVETLGSYVYSWLSFFHVGSVIHQDFKPFLDNVQTKVQKTKENYMATNAEAEELKRKLLASHTKPGSEERRPTPSIKQGYVYMQEKSKIPKTIGRDVLGRWTKYYCVYSRETRIFTMVSANSATKTDMKSAVAQTATFKFKSCSRRPMDSIDKRFCFDVCVDEKNDVMTMQALSEKDLCEWIDAMDGAKQNAYTASDNPSCSTYKQTQLDDIGFEFVQQCIDILEESGIHEQGVYRNCGVTSKVQKLMQLGLDRRKASEKGGLNLRDDEWETKTISSAVKTFLRNLPEPLMTFELHNVFINAAKMGDATMRIDHIHFYVHQLPSQHLRMLEIVVRHLRRVADLSNENLMTVSNLGVCFGPTLLRPKEETVAAIMDIKFCNVVVEVLISNYDKIFKTKPKSSFGSAVPPKPDHHQTNDNGRPLATRSFGTSAPSPITHRSRSPKTPGAGSKIVRSTQVVSSSYSRSMQKRDAMFPSEIARYGAGFDVSDLADYTGDKSSPLTSPTTVAPLASGSVEEIDEAAKKERNSSDSLNSLGSLGSVGDGSTATVVASQDLFEKAVKPKYSVSYASTYNRIPADSSKLTSSISCTAVDSTGVETASFTSLTRQNYLRGTLDTSSQMRPTYKYLSRRVKTLYACTPDHHSELSFEPGQIITNVYESNEDGWLVGTLNGKTGLIPSNYVEPLP